MNILLLSYSRNDKYAGASRVFHMLHEGLSARGHTTRTLHYEDFGPLNVPQIQAVIDKLLMPQFVSLRVSRSSIRGYDVIMASSGAAYPLFRRLRRYPKCIRPATINFLHGLSLFDRQADITEWLAGRHALSAPYRVLTGPLTAAWDAKGSEYADLSIVQNDRDYDFLLRSGLKPNQLARIENAVHPEIMAASGNTPLFNERRGSALLWFGSWIARKGIHALATAFDLILEQVPDATLTIGGTGRSISDIKRNFSTGAASQLRVLERISVKEQISEFGRHSIFLFPSLSEGFGLALVEAMALGLAAVTTSTGVGGDLLRDRVNALLIPPASALHLARAVLSLIKDDSLRISVARCGQDFARTLSAERMIAGYERAFYSVMRQHAKTEAV